MYFIIYILTKTVFNIFIDYKHGQKSINSFKDECKKNCSLI